jgi:hypothetical protein
MEIISGMKEKILEILKKYEEQPFSRPSECATEIVNYIEQRYYPKEFVEWVRDKPSKYYYPPSYNLEETYQYWLTQVKK